MASNKVVSGDFNGSPVSIMGKDVMIVDSGYFISKQGVGSWQIVDSDTKISTGSALARGAVGAFLLGPVGIAAALSAKKKGTHLIAIEFTTGKQCLIEADDKLKNAIVKSMY